MKSPAGINALEFAGVTSLAMLSSLQASEYVGLAHLRGKWMEKLWKG